MKANLPEINFQDPNDFALEKLLQKLEPHLPKTDEIEEEENEESKEEVENAEENNSLSYQVMGIAFDKQMNIIGLYTCI